MFLMMQENYAKTQKLLVKGTTQKLLLGTREWTEDIRLSSGDKAQLEELSIKTLRARKSSAGSKLIALENHQNSSRSKIKLVVSTTNTGVQNIQSLDNFSSLQALSHLNRRNPLQRFSPPGIAAPAAPRPRRFNTMSRQHQKDTEELFSSDV